MDNIGAVKSNTLHPVHLRLPGHLTDRAAATGIVLVPLDTKYVISDTFFPPKLLA